MILLQSNFGLDVNQQFLISKYFDVKFFYGFRNQLEINQTKLVKLAYILITVKTEKVFRFLENERGVDLLKTKKKRR